MNAPTRGRCWVAARGDGGVTLVELLAAIAILGIMLTTISLSISVGLSNTSSAKTTLAGSNLVQFTTRNFDTDVQSAPAAASLAGSACGNGTAVLRIPASDGTTNWITYVTTSDANGSSFVRRVCTPAGVLVEAHTLGTSKSAVAAAAACLPDSTTCRTVTLTLTVAGQPPVILRADRRVS